MELAFICRFADAPDWGEKEGLGRALLAVLSEQTAKLYEQGGESKR